MAIIAGVIAREINGNAAGCIDVAGRVVAVVTIEIVRGTAAYQRVIAVPTSDV